MAATRDGRKPRKCDHTGSIPSSPRVALIFCHSEEGDKGPLDNNKMFMLQNCFDMVVKGGKYRMELCNMTRGCSELPVRFREHPLSNTSRWAWIRTDKFSSNEAVKHARFCLLEILFVFTDCAILTQGNPARISMQWQDHTISVF